MLLPRNLIAATLNAKERKHTRGDRGHDKIPMLHVSSLIKSGPADFFCPREFVLRYMERRETGGGGIPPKFALLYAVGNFYGNYIVQEFLKRNHEYGKYAWGDWTCKCGDSKRHRQCLPEGQKCNKCGHPIEIYLEVDLHNPAKTVIGHADLIFLIDGYFYVYEFKSIERADIVFNEINEPLADHLTQASNYYYMLRDEGKKVSKLIRFVYVDRSMQGLYTEKPFREVYGEAIPKERLVKFYKRANLCHTHIKKGRLPQRKCEDIECGRAKQCTVSLSCFNRQLNTIKRLPLTQSALTRPSLPLASTTGPSAKVSTGSASPLKPKPKRRRIRPAV